MKGKRMSRAGAVSGKKPLRVMMLVLLAALVGGWWQPVLAAAPPEPARAAGEGLLARKTDQLCQKLSGLFEDRLRKLIAHLDAKKSLRIEIRNVFYDPEFRRTFVEFRGSATFGGRLPFKVKQEDFYLTSDGNLAYDLSIEHLQFKGGTITFDFQGDLVVFYDKILYEMAKTIPNLVGAAAFTAAGDYFFAFLEKINLKLLGDSISSTFSHFSAEYTSIIGAEVLHNATAAQKEPLANMIRAAIKSGGITHFFVLTLLKSVGSGIAHYAGASLGAVVGNFLGPGPGTFIGAYFGSKIVSQMAKTTIYYLTVDLPITVFLKKIASAQGQLRGSPRDPVAQARLAEYVQKIFKRVKREVDNNTYKTFDDLLEKIDKFPAAERGSFVPLLQEVRELLRFKVIERKDWYAAKKMNQMRVQLETWGLLGQFAF